MSLFDEAAECVPDDPAGSGVGGLRPFCEGLNDLFRIVFCDVVQIVGDGASDIEFGVGLQFFQ